MNYRLSREDISQAIDNTSPVASVSAAGVAAAKVQPEAFRSIAFEDLPPDVLIQLRRDGTRGDLRSEAEAEAIYDQMVPAEAKGDIEAIRAITNDPDIHWGHIEPHSAGGSNTADNGVYMDGQTNMEIDSNPMTAADVAAAEEFTQEIAEMSSPGTTGDFGEAVGDVLETGALGGVIGAGLGAASRMAQAHGFREAGREDLAQEAEKRIAADAVGGAVNASVRGTSMAAVQLIAGANPLTAGVGLMGPDIVKLIRDKDQLSDSEKFEQVAGISGKCAFAAALVATGPIGFVGLGAWSIWNAYRGGKQAGYKLEPQR